MVDVTAKPVAAEKSQGSQKFSESESQCDYENKVAGKLDASKHKVSERLVNFEEVNM